MRHSSLLYALFACALAASSAAAADDPTASLVRIRALAADGSLRVGSGVVIAPDRIATACHVTRRAATIEIIHGAQRWTAQAQTGSVVRDVCVLSVAPAQLTLPVVHMRDSSQLHEGDRVVAASFPGGRRTATVSDGLVAALYAYDGGDVIRTTAAFDLGSSGGALFDADGRLVGLLAFKTSDSDLRYAVPSEWIAGAQQEPVAFPLAAAPAQLAFWEGSWFERPAFLAIGLLAAGGYHPR